MSSQLAATTRDTYLPILVTNTKQNPVILKHFNFYLLLHNEYFSMEEKLTVDEGTA